MDRPPRQAHGLRQRRVVKFIDEMSKDKPNKVRAWEYFSEAEKINRELAMERFNAMLDDPDGWRGCTAARATGVSAHAMDGTARETAGAKGRETDAGLRATTGAADTSAPAAARTDGTAARAAGTDLPTSGAKISDPAAGAKLRRAA